MEEHDYIYSSDRFDHLGLEFRPHAVVGWNFTNRLDPSRSRYLTLSLVGQRDVQRLQTIVQGLLRRRAHGDVSRHRGTHLPGRGLTQKLRMNDDDSRCSKPWSS